MASNADSEWADLSNWRKGDHMQYAFRNVQELIKTAPIPKSPKPSELPFKAHDFKEFNLKINDSKTLGFHDFLRETSTDGLVILHKGNIVYEYYTHGLGDQTPHILMSMTKSITGLVLGILAETGTINPDALVTTYVPEMASTAYAHATVRHLIDMRTGIKHDDNSHSYRFAMGWEPPLDNEDADKVDLQTFLRDFNPPGSVEHGGAFNYVSVNTDLCGWVLERASGRKLADLISELLWQPMGAEHEAFITTDRLGNARPAGGMCTTTRDLARVGQLIVEGGKAQDGKQVVPAAWVHDMLNNGSKEAWQQGPWTSGFAEYPGMSYRSAWYAVNTSEIFAGGIHGQQLHVDRESGLVVARFSSQARPVDFGGMSLTLKAVDEIKRVLGAS